MLRKILPLIFPIILFISIGFYNTLYVTPISVVQTVPPESLTIGHDRSLHVGDTVTITGRVIAPPRVNYSDGDRRLLLRGTSSWSAFIQDTTNTVWGGIVVRQPDTTHNTLFDQMDSGTKVRLTGTVQEFLDVISGGLTQISLDTSSQVQILSTIKKRPQPINVNVSDFDSLGNVKFRTGEKYEGMYVQLKNVTVGPQSGSGQRHVRMLIDIQGNRIYLRDFSNFFSLAPTGSGWTPWVPLNIGVVVDSISGVIINGAYTDGMFNGNPVYPYVIVPIYPNDIHIANPFGLTGFSNVGPKDYSLSQNYPNPFNPTTIIRFEILKQADVKIVVYNMLGSEVAKITDVQNLPAGSYSADFDATNLATGVYVYKMIAGDYSVSKKMTVLK